MTREVIDNGVLRAVENIQLFFDGKPRDLVRAAAGTIALLLEQSNHHTAFGIDADGETTVSRVAEASSHPR